MSTELIYFALGAVINLVVALIIVRFIYYPVTQDKTYVFTFLAFSTVIYFVLSMMTSTTLSMGVGFGLFAIFSVLRYRTDEMPIREMTYLFIVIALPVMNSVMISDTGMPWLLVANGAIVALLFVLEKGWGFHFSGSKRVIYDRVELIGPAERDRLLADLSERTGLPVIRVDVRRIDLLHDTAELTIYYEEPKSSRIETLPRLVNKEA
ncbi:MAG: DUF4956 domain-containing protein [Anaerolineae bacterium]|nr:DUF4956 domain-containing protein [Anaerolineae bacterium]